MRVERLSRLGAVAYLTDVPADTTPNPPDEISERAWDESIGFQILSTLIEFTTFSCPSAGSTCSCAHSEPETTLRSSRAAESCVALRCYSPFERSRVLIVHNPI